MGLVLSLAGCASYFDPNGTHSTLSWNVSIDSRPNGAKVYVTPPNGPSYLLGTTPLSNVTVPIVVSNDGYVSSTEISAEINGVTAKHRTGVLLARELKFHSDAFPSRLTMDIYAEQKFKTQNYGLLPEIEKNPSRWVGELMAYEGEIISIFEDEKASYVQLMSKYGMGLMVYWPQSSFPYARKGGTMLALGRLGTPMSGKNGFGGSVTTLTMSCMGYKVIAMGENYLLSHKDTYSQWASGELFFPKGESQ